MVIEIPSTRDMGDQGTFEFMLRSSIHAGIFVVDSSGNVSALNPEAARALGIAAPSSLTLEQLPESVRAAVQEAQRFSTPVQNRRIVLSVGHSTPVFATITATPSVLPTPMILVTLQVEAPTGQTEHNLRRLDRLASVGTLSASIAHEIKNALVAVRTFIELLLEKNPDTELASIVRREISRVDSMVTQLLRYSAPAQPKFAPMQLHKLLDHSLRLVQHGSRSREIDFHTDFKAASDAVTGDDYQLEQAFVNLLFNAVESMTGGGQISVSTDRVTHQSAEALRETEFSGEWLRIRISDTGAGIAPEKLAHIFEPFFTTKQHGTGLGLAVTRKIVKEHHGSIQVESVPGKGTTFIVLLPAGAPA
jgi:signal transduction histidine kinase